MTQRYCTALCSIVYEREIKISYDYYKFGPSLKEVRASNISNSYNSFLVVLQIDQQYV